MFAESCPEPGHVQSKTNLSNGKQSSPKCAVARGRNQSRERAPVGSRSPNGHAALDKIRNYQATRFMVRVQFQPHRNRRLVRIRGCSGSRAGRCAGCMVCVRGNRRSDPARREDDHHGRPGCQRGPNARRPVRVDMQGVVQPPSPSEPPGARSTRRLPCGLRGLSFSATRHSDFAGAADAGGQAACDKIT